MGASAAKQPLAPRPAAAEHTRASGEARRARLHEVVEVVHVVEHLLGLPADLHDGVHGEHREAPAQRLSAQQDAVRAVQHHVGHVRRLRPVLQVHGVIMTQLKASTK